MVPNVGLMDRCLHNSSPRLHGGHCPVHRWSTNRLIGQQEPYIASISIKHRSDTKVSGRCLWDVDPRVCVNWYTPATAGHPVIGGNKPSHGTTMYWLGFGLTCMQHSRFEFAEMNVLLLSFGPSDYHEYLHACHDRITVMISVGLQ